MTKEIKQLSASQAIKKELKAAYPSIKFSVTGDHNSVKVKWVDGIGSREISELVAKYEYGKFNSSDDCYEITNNRKDIPQAKYVFTNRGISEQVLQAQFVKLQNYRYEFKNLASLDEFSEDLFKNWRSINAREYILRVLSDITIKAQESLEV